MTNALITTGFLVCYFLFPAVLYVFLKLFSVDLFKFEIESFVIANLLILSYAGLFPLFFELDIYRVAIDIRDPEILATMLACSIWSIFSFSAGVVVVRTAFPANSAATSQHKGLSQGQLTAFAGLLMLCCTVLALYLAQVERIALISALKGDSAVANIERSLMTNAFSGKYHWYKLFMHEILWCVATICFASALVATKTSGAVLATLSVVLMVFTTSMSAEKSQTVIFILSMYVVFVATKKSGIYGAARAIASVFLTIISMVAIYAMIYDISLVSALTQVLSRAFTGGITPAYLYLTYFPEHHDYLLGRSFPNPGGLFPQEPYLLTVEIMNWLAPQYAATGIVGSSPTVFWGELYANFGYWGVAIIPYFVGSWVGLVCVAMNMLPRSPVVIGLSVWLAFHFATLASTGVSNFIVDFYLVLVSLFIGAAVVAGIFLDRILFKDSGSAGAKPGGR